MRLKQVALTFALVIMSIAIFSAHHEKTTTPTENNYVLLSTFGTAQGERTDDLEKELIAMVKQRESDGFDNCGLYRHSFVGPRLFYAYCYFTDYAQLDAIQAKARARSTSPMNSIQKYSSHADNIVQVQKRNMTEAPENSVFMTWRFGPYLTIMNAKKERNCYSLDSTKPLEAAIYTYTHGVQKSRTTFLVVSRTLLILEKKMPLLIKSWENNGLI